MNLVLPKNVRDRLIQELDKRLDLDLDEILESPKLRLKLSPAELDKSLLELYDNIIDGPGGDLLRVIGGGGRVGMQNLYMRRRSLELRRRKGEAPEIFDSVLEDVLLDSEDKSPTERIRWALRRNLPQYREQNEQETERSEPKMTLTGRTSWSSQNPASIGKGAFVPPVRRPMAFSLLI